MQWNLCSRKRWRKDRRLSSTAETEPGATGDTDDEGVTVVVNWFVTSEGVSDRLLLIGGVADEERVGVGSVAGAVADTVRVALAVMLTEADGDGGGSRDAEGLADSVWEAVTVAVAVLDAEGLSEAEAEIVSETVRVAESLALIVTVAVALLETVPVDESLVLTVAVAVALVVATCVREGVTIRDREVVGVSDEIGVRVGGTL